jgi:hypothetical protein
MATAGKAAISLPIDCRRTMTIAQKPANFIESVATDPGNSIEISRM